MMTSREQFEAEYSKIIGSPACSIKELRAGDVYRGKGGDRLSIAWWAWQASRETVDVVLPTAINTEEIGRAISKERTMTRLALAGIKVKGE